MRTDILDCHRFYATALGAAARRHIGARLAEAWGAGAGLRVAAFGYGAPYLGAFTQAERRIALAPEGQGALAWPEGERNCAALIQDSHWPLPDASIDRLLIVHGLEEAADPRRLLREAWRVLTDSGRLIIVAAHRRGLWSIAGATPFAAGAPYLRGQLETLLRLSTFRLVAWSGALHFPPLKSPSLSRFADAFERAGGDLWPAFCGVLLAEAEKDMLAPIGAAARAKRGAMSPQRARPAAARAGLDLARRPTLEPSPPPQGE